MKPIEVVNRWYYSRDVKKILGLSNRQLQYWDETGFFPPSEKTKTRRKYSFLDLIQLSIVTELLKKDLSLQKIRKSIERLRDILPGVTLPFLELEIDTDGESIFVHHKGAWFEAYTGQYMISFKVEDLYGKVLNFLVKKKSRAAIRPAEASNRGREKRKARTRLAKR